jgi:hypothetical protein
VGRRDAEEVQASIFPVCAIRPGGGGRRPGEEPHHGGARGRGVAMVVQSVAEGAATGDAPLLRADGGGHGADRERERVKEAVPTSDKGFALRIDSEALPTR